MRRFSTIVADTLDTTASYRLITSCVLPRPIAWITTVNLDGIVNAAPFSSYNYIAHSPPMVAVNIASRAGVLKDTARNIIDTEAFVINVPVEANLDALHQTSADYDHSVSETDLHGVELIPSHFVAPPRIASTPIQMECRLNQALVLGRGLNTLYIADVVAFHLDGDVFDGRHVDLVKLRPVMRLAGPHYATIGEIIHRPQMFATPGTTAAEAPT